jgi:hypothetical protein
LVESRSDRNIQVAGENTERPLFSDLQLDAKREPIGGGSFIAP